MSARRQLQEAIEAHLRGDVAGAKQLYRQVLQSEPRNAAALANLAVIAIGDRDHKIAEDYLRTALSIRSDDAGMHSNLGVALRGQGKFEEAIRAYRQALRLKPDYPDAHHNLGNALKDHARPEEAVAAYRNAIRLKPDYPDAHNNLGNALREWGRPEEAIAAYRQAIQLKPSNPEAYSNLGVTLKELGRVEEAIAAHREAIRLKPDYPEAHNNLGVALRARGEFAEAAAAYREAVRLKPDYPDAYNNLGNVLQDQGRLADAIVAYQHAVELKPDYPDAFSQLVHQRQHACDWTSFEADQERLLGLVRRGDAVAPFILLASRATPADQLLCARRWAHGSSLKVHQTARFRRDAPRSDTKIRLGYLSADFHEHATAYLMAELFERHDRSRFELFGYSYGPDDGSRMRARLTGAFDRLVDIRLMPHGETARRIHDDRIDILIDLKGYTTHARTEILAHRPAPVQVNYLGYPGTMGAEFIDYIIVDPFIAPMDHQAFYSERLARLPDCYQPNDSKREISERTPSRTECDLPERGFVFCCFNNSYKITPAVFDIWMRLLEAVPNSVLWLLEANALARSNLRREAAARRVDPDRLVFAPRIPLPAHLARHRRADLFLDTLPCNAHTTASDALWAGLPVLTCAGTTFAGRVAGSLLRAVEMSELITSSLEDYAALALRLADEPERLAALKRKLDRHRLSAPLFDIARFTRNIETAYRNMWEDHCSGRLDAKQEAPSAGNA